MKETDRQAVAESRTNDRNSRTDLQKELILQKLREKGCRITKQRRMLLDIILEGDCSCCKEIYYKAVKRDRNIGTATVYRMVNTLEEMGAISRNDTYRLVRRDGRANEACTIELNDNTVVCLSEENWNRVLSEGLKTCGYLRDQEIRHVRLSSK